MEQIAAELPKNPEVVKKVNAVFQVLYQFAPPRRSMLHPRRPAPPCLTHFGTAYLISIARHILQWDIKGDKGVEIWTMDLKAGKIAKGAAAKADCTIACSEEDFLGMISGKANSQAMFMQAWPPCCKIRRCKCGFVRTSTFRFAGQAQDQGQHDARHEARGAHQADGRQGIKRGE